MSLIIKVRGADFSKLNLPVLEQTLYGFPAKNLKGLYLLEDGTPNAVTTGPFFDSSGHGNHASVRNTWAAPRKGDKSGLKTDNESGMVLQTPIAASTSFSWVLVARHNMELSTLSGAYPAFVGQSYVLATNMSDSQGNLNGLVINTDLDKEPSHSSFNEWGVYSGHGGLSRRNMYGSDASLITVIGITFDIKTGNIYMQDIAGHTVTSTNIDVAEAIRTQQGEICFGCWKHGLTPVSGEVHLFAHYDEVLSQDSLLKAMLAAKQRVESRGVAVV